MSDYGDWLLDKIIKGDPLMAKPDGDDDKIFQTLEKDGIVKRYDSMFGFRYYAITAEGRTRIKFK